MVDNLRLDVDVVAETKGVSAVITQMNALAAATRKAGAATRANTRAFDDYNGAVRGKGGLAAVATQATRTAPAVQQVARATRVASGEQENFNAITARYANYDMAGTLLTVAAAIGVVGAATAVAFAQQERAFTEVERILGIDPNVDVSSITNLREELRALTEEVPVAFSELSEIASFGAALDIPAEQLDEFSSTVARFIAITDVSAEEAGKSLARIFQYTNDDDVYRGSEAYEQLGSAILRLGNVSIATEAEVLKFSQSLSPLASRTSVSAAQILAMATATASFASINVEGAGSAFSRVFANIDRQAQQGGDSLQAFADMAGVTASQFQAMWAEDAGGAFNEVLSGLNRDIPNLVTNMDNLGIRNERDRRVVQALAINYKEYSRYLDDANDTLQEGTALGDAYAYVADDLASKWQVFLNVLQNTGADIGAVLAPAFSALLGVVTGVLQVIGDLASNPATSWIIGLAGAVAGAVAVWAAWRGILALTTAGMLAFRVATEFLGSASIAQGAKFLAGQLTGVGTAAAGAAVQVGTLNAATSGAAVAGAGRMRTALGGVVSFLGGPWGLALGVGAAAVGGFASSAVSDIRAARSQIISDLDDVSYRAREGLLDELMTPGFAQWWDDSSFFNWDFSGLTNAGPLFREIAGDADRLRVALDYSNGPDPDDAFRNWAAEADLTYGELDKLKGGFGELTSVLNQAADDGQMISALQGLSEVTGLTDQDLRTFVSGLDSGLIPKLREAAEQVGINTSRHDWFNLLLDETAIKAEAAGEGTTVMDEAMANAESEAEALQEELDTLLDTLTGFRTPVGGIQAALDELWTTLNGSGAAFEEFAESGESITSVLEGGTSPAAIALRDHFREVDQAGRDAAAAILETGGTADEARAAYAEARAGIEEYIAQMTGSPEVAATWAEGFFGPFESILDLIDDTGEALINLPGASKPVSIAFDAETGQFYDKETGVRLSLEDLANATAAPDIDANPDPFNAKVDNANRDADGLDRRIIKPSVDANSDPFNQKFVRVRANLSGLEAKEWTAVLRAEDHISGILSGALSQLHNLTGRDWTVGVQYDVGYSAPRPGLAGPLISTDGSHTGGFTGRGAKYEVSGYVHKGEYVIPKHHVNQSTGLPYADALGKLVRGASGPGYASGGYVNPSVSFPNQMALTPGTIQQIAQAVQQYVVLDSQDVTRAVNSQNSRFNQTGAF